MPPCCSVESRIQSFEFVAWEKGAPDRGTCELDLVGWPYRISDYLKCSSVNKENRKDKISIDCGGTDRTDAISADDKICGFDRAVCKMKSNTVVSQVLNELDSFRKLYDTRLYVCQQCGLEFRALRPYW